MLSIAVQRNEGERRKAYFVCVYPLLTQCEGVIAAAALGDVGEETPVHEYVPGEGVRRQLTPPTDRRWTDREHSDPGTAAGHLQTAGRRRRRC